MTDYDAPVPVVHPAPLTGALRGGAERMLFVRAETPIRLVRRDPAVFRSLGTSRIAVFHDPRHVHAGPDGLWRTLVAGDGRPIRVGVVLDYLAGRLGGGEALDALDAAFQGTPLAAYGTGYDPDEAWKSRAQRGADPAALTRIRHDGRAEAAALAADWLAREFALVDDTAMVRWRPMATVKLGQATGWMMADERVVSSLDHVAATPATWEPLHRLSAAMGRPREIPKSEWRALAEHWPDDAGEDIRWLLNTQAGLLRQRITRRLEQVRAKSPGDVVRGTLERLEGPLWGIARRACLGLAGASGREGDLDVFRDAVALEARLAGAAGNRTGIDSLHRYVEEVVGARGFDLPEGDGASLEALAPGCPL